MQVGVQFTGTLQGNQTAQWFTHSWNPDWHVIWTFVPVTVRTGAPQIEWSVASERATSGVTYWLTVRNLTPTPVDFEGRFAIVN